MRQRSFVIFAALFLQACSVFGQAVDFASSRVPMAELAGPWRFHTGDNPAWADPGFDDSGWSLLQAGRPWTQQGYPTYSGVAWYRLRVLLPADHGKLAIYLTGVQVSAQVFANGRLIGQAGGLPPHPRFDVVDNPVFRIPDDAAPTNRPLVLAIRVWLWPRAAGLAGGLSAVPRIGEASTIGAWHQSKIDEAVHGNVSGLIDSYVNLLTALAGFGLFLLRRKEREYLWWGVSQLLWAGFLALIYCANFLPIRYFWFYGMYFVLISLASGFQFLFYATFLRQGYGWLFRGAIFFLLLSQSLFLIANLTLFFGAVSLLGQVSDLLAATCMLGMLWRGARGRVFGAALLFACACPSFSMTLMRLAARLPSLAATPWATWMEGFMNRAITWPIPVGAFQLAGDLEMYAVLVILLTSYARSRGDEERLESELEAARTVQKVLIPDEVPAIPGFKVAAVYKPASQVGGDFFQIIGNKSGGALIAIGDVSGKGMPAAMTVSLLVGTFRTLAHYTQNPAEILRAMNQRMLTRSDGGFTTCLVLRLDPSGRVTAANAGHLAPYLGGREVPIDYGLPLGLAEESKYAESHFQLRAGEQLTLLTDGVPEARNVRGDLFGFEKTAAISSDSAESIAETARVFGQHDDVTVVRVVMDATPGTATKSHSPALQVSGEPARG